MTWLMRIVDAYRRLMWRLKDDRIVVGPSLLKTDWAWVQLKDGPRVLLQFETGPVESFWKRLQRRWKDAEG